MKKQNIISVWKITGSTPLDVIKKLKKTYPEYGESKISYAGRLDPMAEGVLLLLIDEENKKRRKYEDLNKEYLAEIILGISTDSYDALGIIQKTENKELKNKEIEKTLKKFLGKYRQTYPPYSSKTVNGKPLYFWARENRLSEIKIPKKTVEVFIIKLESSTFVTGKGLFQEIIKKIALIKGNFRQEKIMNKWVVFNNKFKNEKFIKIKIYINCSSGTYIRGVADKLGRDLKCGAFALSITRVSVGSFNKKNSLKID